jgi:hypothetical protein
MKTERVVFLATPQFKALLQSEAQREGVGVAELIRRRVEGAPSEEERLLIELTGELRHAVEEARGATHPLAAKDLEIRQLDQDPARSPRLQAGEG